MILGGTTDEPSSRISANMNLVSQRVALLINYIRKDQEATFVEALRWIPNLTFLLSVLVEPQRDYDPELNRLDVRLQKTWTLRRKWRHKAGFTDDQHVHLPLDTLERLRQLQPDVIVSYELGMRSLMSAAYRLMHRRSRLVLAVFISEHTERSWSALRVRLRRALLRVADVVTYHGSSGKRYLESLEVPASKLRLLPYAAHPAMVYHGPTERTPAVRRRLLYVGQFTSRKAPLRMLEVLSRWCLAHPNRVVEISMVGRGPLRETIEMGEYPANLEVTMVGSVAPAQMPAILAHHGVMVFPTLADEWGLVVDEALHSGLPVVSSEYAQATLELVIDAQNGWRFRPDVDDEFYDAIDRMMRVDLAELDRMAARGRAGVAERTPAWAGERLAEVVRAALAT
jgi:glycosyltransferase involved in cell wall biosynthesis